MHVQRCNTCQRTAYGPRHHKGIPYVVPISAPFATVAFDIVGPIGIKATRKGNKYILTAIDYFTRYMEAFAIPDETPETVAAAMLQFVGRHGCPSRVVTDGGSCFTAKTKASV